MATTKIKSTNIESGGIEHSNLANSGATAGTYGAAASIPVLTVTEKGIITAASTVAVAGVSNFTYSSGDETLTISTADGNTYEADISGLASETYVDTAESDAVSTANSYTDGRETAITTAYQAYADQAELDAVSTANAYTDQEVAALVDSSPGTLDTLNELAAALGDDPNFASTVSANIGTRALKTTTVSAGTGLSGGGDLSANRTINLANTSVVAGTYGSASQVPVITVDAQGRITSASSTAVAGVSSTDYNTSTGVLTINTSDGGSFTEDLGVGTADAPTFAGGTMTGDLSFGDNDKAIFGAGSDLQIYHDTTASRIVDVGTGSLKIQAENFAVNNVGDTENMITAIPNGAVQLFYDGLPKFATTSTGVDVTGNITLSGTVDGRDVAADGTKLDGIASSANNYTHPSHPGDDASVDTGALTGATVISDLDFNITTDTLGHVTDANASVATRTLTLADLGYTGETNATADQTAAQILTAVKTVDGAGSGLDADLLDGVQGSSYLRSDASTIPVPVYSGLRGTSGNSIGDLYYDSTAGTLRFWNGSGWIATNLIPVVNSVSGNIYAGVSSTVTLSVTDQTDLISVIFKEGSTELANISSVDASSGSAAVAVPSSVYNQSAGDTITISIVNADGTPSNNTVNKTIQSLPTGGTIRTYPGYRSHTFTSAGTFNAPSSLTYEYIAVAGGGGGGRDQGAGGGAGGAVVGTFTSSGAKSITIGAGGSGGNSGGADAGYNGGTTSIAGVISCVGGGGAGAYQDTSGRSGGSGGGSGGMSGYPTSSVQAAGTSGQGNSGGASNGGEPGGGGGKTGSGSTNGDGGAGIYNSYSTGSNIGYAGGGGGQTGSGATAFGGTSGAASSASSGTANTGGGGGGCRNGNSSPGSGGSGIVVIRYQL